MSTSLPIVKLASRGGRSTLERLVRRGEAVLDKKTLKKAEALVDDVRTGGDRALLAAVRKLDGFVAETVADLALTPSPGDEAELPAGFVEAFERAKAAVERFHAPQAAPQGLPVGEGGYTIEEEGVTLTEVVRPLRRVGIYIPGGRASYPSTVLMTAIPARLAGVAEIAVATPPLGYQASAPLRYALARLELHEVWGMGGAQAIAAFAYGTETIGRVDKIVGPGNAWVTAAKRLVLGDVGIDGLAGPSEVVIVADGSADPAWLAADLLAQAEHDPRAAAVLITTDPKLAKKVAQEVERQLEDLDTEYIARQALASFGAVLIVVDIEEALDTVERIAPEHLQLVGFEAEGLASLVRSAGAVFVGASSPEVFGDYVAGPSHVLPTCGSARFASGLSVADFLRRSHRVRFTPEAAAHRAAAAAVLADAEGLPAHAAAARRRLR
jgi:histidinol dehydrogenase